MLMKINLMKINLMKINLRYFKSVALGLLYLALAAPIAGIADSSDDDNYECAYSGTAAPVFVCIHNSDQGTNAWGNVGTNSTALLTGTPDYVSNCGYTKSMILDGFKFTPENGPYQLNAEYYILSTDADDCLPW